MTAAKKSSKGCFFYGCLASVLLFILVVAGIWYAARGVTQAVTKLVNEYTDRAPRELPSVSLPQERIDEIKKRFEDFRVAFKDRQAADTLTLTAEELNGLIQSDSKFKELKDHVFFEISDNLLRGEVSIPVGSFDLGFGDGLYLNGSAEFELALDWRGLAARISEMEINGKALPDAFMNHVRDKNILADADFDDETQALINRLESIRIEENMLIIELKSSDEEEGADPTAEVDSPAAFEQP